jgi:uncharacterized membrane protein required for colicin V production
MLGWRPDTTGFSGYVVVRSRRDAPSRKDPLLNTFDVLIIGSFLAIIGIGFFSGITKVTAAILAIYFAAIVAAAFYRVVDDQVAIHIPSMGSRTGALFVFTILFFAFFTLFVIFLTRWLGDLKLPKRLEIFDNIGGAALGVAVSGLAVTLAAMLLIVLLQALNQTFGGDVQGSMVGTMHHQMANSELVPVFLKAAPFLERTISPWFPGGLPPILSGGVEA